MESNGSLSTPELPLNLIRENKVALRAVDRRTEAYQQLVDSIKNFGILNPVSVREVVDPETGEKVYGLIDGLHRYTGAIDAGLKTIPVNIKSASDAESLEMQIIANIQRIETKPFQYSEQLKRILSQNPLLTITELSMRLSRSASWLIARLSLDDLHKEIAPLVDEGKINLSNAYALAKLPHEEQWNYLDSAMSMTPQEFSPTILNRKKELEKAKREGRDPKPAGFIPVPHPQKAGDVRSEMDNPTIGPYLIRTLEVKTPLEAWQLALQWALHLDPESVKVQEQKYAEKRVMMAEKREEAKKERVKKRAEEATERAAQVEAAVA